MDLPAEAIGHKRSNCFPRGGGGARTSIFKEVYSHLCFFLRGDGMSGTLPTLLICMLFSRLKLSNSEKTKLVDGSFLF